MKNKNPQHLSNDQLWNCIDDNFISVSQKEHLDSCMECTKLLSELNSIHKELSQLPVIDPPPNFAIQVVDKWEQSQVKFPWFISLLISSFILLFTLSMYLAVQSEWAYNGKFIQLSSFLIIVCIFRLFDFLNRKDFRQSELSETLHS